MSSKEDVEREGKMEALKQAMHQVLAFDPTGEMIFGMAFSVVFGTTADPVMGLKITEQKKRKRGSLEGLGYWDTSSEESDCLDDHSSAYDTQDENPEFCEEYEINSFIDDDTQESSDGDDGDHDDDGDDVEAEVDKKMADVVELETAEEAEDASLDAYDATIPLKPVIYFLNSLSNICNDFSREMVSGAKFERKQKWRRGGGL